MYETLTLDSENDKIKNLNGVEDYLSKCKHDTTIVQDLPTIFSKPSCDGNIYDLNDILGVLGYYPPEGKHICELLNVSHIMPNDLYLVSQKPYTTSADSRKITYKELSALLFKDIFNAMSVHTMAFERKEMYAISSHNHDKIYSRVYYHPNPKYDPNDSRYVGDTNISTLGVFNISNDILTGDGYGKYDNIDYNPSALSVSISSYNVNIPKILVSLPPKPMIGTLKFIGIQTIQKLIDSNSLSVNSTTYQVNPFDTNNKIRKDYDGWVFANGTTIHNIGNQLSDAVKIYGNADGEVVVPVLSNFIKCNPLSNTNSISYHHYNVSLPKHNHVLEKAEFNATLSVISVLIGFNNGNKLPDELSSLKLLRQACHWSQDPTYPELKLSCLVDINNSVVPDFNTTTNTGTGDRESYPTHNIIPIMIYIGGETRDYYEMIYAKYHK